MKRTSLALVALLLTPAVLVSRDLPWLEVSDSGPYIVTEEGEPFLWLGDTAWEMIHRLNREEIDRYLSDRAAKGFTLIQTVVLAELDGLETPNAYGNSPLVGNDPTRLDKAYFEHVDYAIERAAKLGLYIGLLPTWGDKFNLKWGTGPVVFTPENAAVYGEQLAARYATTPNIVWILGGDRIPETDEHYAIMRAMVAGIRKVDVRHLITYHPQGGHRAGELFDDAWLQLDMYQSGHSREAREYSFVVEGLAANSERPIINGESRYEDIPDRFWEEHPPGVWLDAADVRVSAWWSMLAGAAGYTYGCNNIWQMYRSGREPTIQARTDWDRSLDLPGARHMGYLRELLEALPWQNLEYDPNLILGDNPRDGTHIVAAVDDRGEILVAYTPQGKAVRPDLARLTEGPKRAWWFNPRSGRLTPIGQISPHEAAELTPWASGRGSDFVLIVAGKGRHPAIEE
jgi:hypothetical protein